MHCHGFALAIGRSHARQLVHIHILYYYTMKLFKFHSLHHYIIFTNLYIIMLELFMV